MTPPDLPRTISKHGGPGIFAGVLISAAGVVIILHPHCSAASAVFLARVLLAIAAAQIVFALSSQRGGNVTLKLLVGAVYAVAGVELLLFAPEDAAGLARVVGTMLIVQGIAEAGIGSRVPAFPARGWCLFSAFAGLLSGIFVLSHQDIAIWLIGTLTGTAVAINGLTRIVAAATMLDEARDEVRESERLVSRRA